MPTVIKRSTSIMSFAWIGLPENRFPPTTRTATRDGAISHRCRTSRTTCVAASRWRPATVWMPQRFSKPPRGRPPMTRQHPTYTTDKMAEFVVRADQSDLSGQVLPTLKRNVLDSIACALGGLDGELIPSIRAHAEQFSSRPTATFIGGGRTSVDQAAFFHAVLVRYPDLLDTFLTPGGLCHPADNFGAVLAVAEHVEASGADFLLALAIAYELQCRFSTTVPVMTRGLNHALQLTMSAAAGSAKLLAL